MVKDNVKKNKQKEAVYQKYSISSSSSDGCPFPTQFIVRMSWVYWGGHTETAKEEKNQAIEK